MAAREEWQMFHNDHLFHSQLPKPVMRYNNHNSAYTTMSRVRKATHPSAKPSGAINDEVLPSLSFSSSSSSLSIRSLSATAAPFVPFS
jgi:hypothetical protein